MPNMNVINLAGEKVKDITLNPEVFGIEPNQQVIFDAVVMQRNCERQGTHDVKNRREVRGGGRKPYRQKGTGNARHDEKSAPQFTGGGVVFAPKPRDFSQKVNKKMRDIAFASAVSQKIKQGEVVIVDEIAFADAKTKAASEFLNTFGLDKRTVIVTNGNNDNALRATANIKKVSCVDASLLNVAEVVENKYLVFTKDAIKKLEEAYV